jgi:ABC-type sugar transport system ATPase subunit
VGDNGAGKSTLIKALSGIQPADEGRIFFEGREVRITSPSDATRLGIETVYQDLALCDNLDTVANLFLGRELVGPQRLAALLRVLADRTWNSMQGQLAGLGVTTIASVHTPVNTLSGGQRQAVAVARPTLWDAKLLILDEPTAALGVTQTAQVLELIQHSGTTASTSSSSLTTSTSCSNSRIASSCCTWDARWPHSSERRPRATRS